MEVAEDLFEAAVMVLTVVLSLQQQQLGFEVHHFPLHLFVVDQFQTLRT
jgi:hypothetical protein